MYDLLIKNATVIDGTGNPGYPGSVACRGGKLRVLAADCAEEAKTVIDGTGKAVCPGFVDCHSHGDVPLGRQFNSLSKLSQGITTHVAGPCGFSMFPVDPDNLKLMQAGMAIFTDVFPEEMERFTSFENYLSYARSLRLPENVMFLAGHVSLRIAAMGFENRRPTGQEMQRMKDLLREAMEHGAGGMSSGLIYIPSVFADKEELTELCRVVAEYGGVYTTHMRNESNHALDSVRESIEVGRASGCRVHISHLKVCGRPYWGAAGQILQLIEQANREGVHVTADQYPYTASMTHLNVSIPPRYFTGGTAGMVKLIRDPAMRQQIKREMMDPAADFENQYLNCGGFDKFLISRAQATPDAEGKTIGDRARELGVDPFDLFFDLLIENDGVVSTIYFSMDEGDVFHIIRDPHVMVGTDGIVKSEHERAHPRAYGAFPRAIRYFVRENHVLPLEKMIEKMTSRAAELMNMEGKGIIADGKDADLVVFDPETISDAADFINSNRLADGIDRVIVAGEIVYQDKKLTGAKPGQVLLFHK